MASKQGGSSRKIGRNSRSGGVTHTMTLYRMRNHKAKSTRGSFYSRSAGVCANCGITVGPFRAGPAAGSRICDPRIDGRAHECVKRRAALDAVRYPAVVFTPVL
jgi:hypothetical protein